MNIGSRSHKPGHRCSRKDAQGRQQTPQINPIPNARLPMRAASERSWRPSACDNSVCVPMPRKLKIQNTLDNAMVPTPSAASGAAPNRAMNAVSTSPVSGSATKDSNTGNIRPSSVRCGRTKNGWSAVLASFCIGSHN